MRYLCVLMLFVVANTSSAQTSQFCFASAETYYEQVYCQLQAKAQTKNLPSFFQFRKNPEAVQYSLLKRPADRNVIKLPAPAKAPAKETVRPAVSQPISRATSESLAVPTLSVSTSVFSEQKQSANTQLNHACLLQGKILQCGNRAFHLIGNKANHRLKKEALSVDNKMALPDYEGGNLEQYLVRAYEVYIIKMCEIGLCGVSMSYGKFAFLYQDIHSKGLDFSQRFELMFGFLKKDKTTMGVSESVTIPLGLTVNDCSLLGEVYYVCENKGRNLIFLLQ